MNGTCESRASVRNDYSLAHTALPCGLCYGPSNAHLLLWSRLNRQLARSLFLVFSPAPLGKICPPFSDMNVDLEEPFLSLTLAMPPNFTRSKQFQYERKLFSISLQTLGVGDQKRA